MTEIPEPASPLPWDVREHVDHSGVWLESMHGGWLDGPSTVMSERLTHNDELDAATRADFEYAKWACNNAQKLAAEVARLRAVSDAAEAVLPILIDRDYGRDTWEGPHIPVKHNAVGHAHEIPGVWDSDNGSIAGKPCFRCTLVAKLGAAIKALKEQP